MTLEHLKLEEDIMISFILEKLLSENGQECMCLQFPKKKLQYEYKN